MSLLSGCFLFLLGIAHILYGEKVQLPQLKAEGAGSESLYSVKIMIFQGGVLLLFLSSFQILSSLGIFPFLILATTLYSMVVSLNFLTFISIALLKRQELLKSALPQMIFVIVVVLLNILSLLN
ncbi:hypothetical protein Q73_06280 [Bacillus coahuilensis m2-6]|uniref:hypothetical protein n=1 Tax=Bacillus coahuilensis TaxID=408580 RepID=UPI0001850EC1|nr:hypothetical protein [Bacillus coahuilensis]KUP08350.1 hypothetical protein Q73_06280 [Bacillus coahuilensis m2-6]